jgi:hypothetical protein
MENEKKSQNNLYRWYVLLKIAYPTY